MHRKLQNENGDGYWFVRVVAYLQTVAQPEAALLGDEASVGRRAAAKDIPLVIFSLIYYDEAGLKFHLCKIVPAGGARGRLGAGAAESEAKACFESQ